MYVNFENLFGRNELTTTVLPDDNTWTDVLGRGDVPTVSSLLLQQSVDRNRGQGTRVRTELLPSSDNNFTLCVVKTDDNENISYSF